MKIIITIPELTSRHGGLRIIMEWANRLTKWHTVVLLVLEGQVTCNWFKIDPKVIVTRRFFPADCLIVTSPHSVNFLGAGCKKEFVFCQMAEHMFQPNNEKWQMLCEKFYTAPVPMFYISKWNIRLFKERYGRTAESIYLRNGVNFDDFPITQTAKDFQYVLVEGWDAFNECKDVEQLGPRVAQLLKQDGYKILAYSGRPIKSMRQVPNQFFERPTLQRLNQLYEKATILIKATKYDARACAPVESMTKGTVTVRAIVEGDDDLDETNSVRVGYSLDQLYKAASDLLKDPVRFSRLSSNGMQYVKTSCDWGPIMNFVNQIICRER